MHPALRSLAKSPGFAAIAIVIVAIGIGAATAMFSTLNALVLRPLSLPEPEQLAVLYESNVPRGLPQFSVSIPNYYDWRSRNQTWASLAAMSTEARNVTGHGEPELVQVREVTANFLPTLGIALAHGRNFLDEEDRPGAARVAVITAGFWQRYFGGRPDVVGSTLQLDNNACTIVGITAAGAAFPGDEFEILVPLAVDPAKAERDDRMLDVFGRLKPGLPLERGEAELKTLAAQIGLEHPDKDQGWSAAAVSLAGQIVGRELQRALYVLVGAVALLLLIACANLSNLMLVRAIARAHELAVRTALGGSRWQIARQLIAESLVVTVLGGAAGVVLAWWGIDALRSLPLPRASEISADGRVLALACGATLLTGLLAGVGPALTSSRARPQDALKSRSPRGGHRSRLRDAMVVAQVALSLMLLVGVALLAKSFWRLLQVDPGFNPEHALTVSLRPTRNVARFYDAVDRDIAALPGVTAVGSISALPLASLDSTQNNIFAMPPATIGPEQTVQAHWRLIHGDYFGAMQIPILRGRDFRELTPAEARTSMVISQSLARLMWGDADPIGRQIKRVGALFTVVGVVGDVRSQQLGVAPAPTFYMSIHRFVAGPQSLVVRTTGDTAPLVSALRNTIRKIDPAVPVFRVRTLGEIRAESLRQERLIIALLGSFAAVALLLASLGTYGVVAFAVQQRTPEIGIRMAIGAQQRDVLRLVLAQGARLAAAGILLGLAASLAGARVLATLLYATRPGDALSYAAATLMLAAAALGAAWVPARRATRVDPIAALRAE